MSEAETGSAVLEDVDENTFVYFSQFAYTGDYTVLNASSPSDTAADEIQHDLLLAADADFIIGEPSDVSFGSYNRGLSARKKAKMKKTSLHRMDEPILMEGAIEETKSKEVLWKEFQALSYFSPELPLETDSVNSEKLLAHARIYVFADRYIIGPLKNLSLDKLHHSLVAYAQSASQVGGIVELLHWTYANTCDSSPGSPVDQLRSLTVHYTACSIETLAESEEFEILLKENGALGKDIIKMLLKRLN